jgi:predicted DNA-binding protein
LAEIAIDTLHCLNLASLNVSKFELDVASSPQTAPLSAEVGDSAVWYAIYGRLNMSPNALDSDWSNYNIDDTALKIWIPEVLDECLDRLVSRFEQTKSDLARNALMIHVHGRGTFEYLVENKLWRLRRRQQVEDNRKFSLQTTLKLRDSPRTSFIRAFGKNTKDLKVWLPRSLESSIAALAIDAGLTASEYSRRALTAYYLGRTTIDPLMPNTLDEE